MTDPSSAIVTRNRTVSGIALGLLILAFAGAFPFVRFLRNWDQRTDIGVEPPPADVLLHRSATILAVALVLVLVVGVFVGYRPLCVRTLAVTALLLLVGNVGKLLPIFSLAVMWPILPVLPTAVLATVTWQTFREAWIKRSDHPRLAIASALATTGFITGIYLTILYFEVIQRNWPSATD